MIDFALDTAIDIFRQSDESGALWDAEELAAAQAAYIAAQACYVPCANPCMPATFIYGGHVFTVVLNSKGEVLLFLSVPHEESKPIAWPGFDCGHSEQTGTGNAGNASEDAPPNLCSLWRRALRFRIGDDPSISVGQLPNAKDFPGEFPTDDPAAGYHLGEVLGVAALKLFRPWPVTPDEVVVLDPMGAWLEELAQCDYTMDCARLRIVGRVVEMALLTPGRLPVLIARVDALSNDDLHRMAMDAVQGRSVEPDVFEGLME